MKLERILYRLVMFCLLMMTTTAFAVPKMLAYSAQPTPYFDDNAQAVAKIYDGFFFVVGSWDTGVRDLLGLPGEAPKKPEWQQQVKVNLDHLRAAGATESVLGVSFAEDGEWPSAETLLKPAYKEKLARHFGVLGRAAKELGFRGVCIDVEYPYKRYRLDHPTYTYTDYTADDLLHAAKEQGRAIMQAVLDAYPEAVIWLLPGELGGSPIVSSLTSAMLDVMAERDAPGGCQLGYERSYCLYDPASQVAISRVGECTAETLLSKKALDYWKRRCSVAPGVWPLHRVETGGKDYPMLPWEKELDELRQQMATLRATAKRYIWSYSGSPVWVVPTPENAERYGFKPAFEGAQDVVRSWQNILTDRSAPIEPRIKKLVKVVAAYDKGRMDGAGFCERFGTPPDWMVLGYLDNPFVRTAFSAPMAWKAPFDFNTPVQGRDNAVHWFRFMNRDPLGAIRPRVAFDDRSTDKCSIHLVCTVSVQKETPAFFWCNWDDGAIIRLNDTVILDRSKYPERGHGLYYKDRYMFEEKVPVTVPKGESTLSITSYNSHGSWGVNLRIGDEEAYPIEGLRFGLPK